MAEGVCKEVLPQVAGPSDQLLLNKFFDLIIPSMRKGCDGKEEKENGKEKNCENSGPITSTAGTATVRAKMEETGAEQGQAQVQLELSPKFKLMYSKSSLLTWVGGGFYEINANLN